MILGADLAWIFCDVASQQCVLAAWGEAVPNLVRDTIFVRCSMVSYPSRRYLKTLCPMDWDFAINFAKDNDL